MTHQPASSAHTAAPSHGGSDSDSAAAASSWLRNLQRGSAGGGFWTDAAWYDAHLSQRMPQYNEMVRRLVLSLPPLEPNARVLDWLCGSGLVAAAVAQAYPEASFTLLDSDARRLDRARARFQRDALHAPALLQHTVTPQQALPPTNNDNHGSFALVTACLALHHLMEHAPATGDRESHFIDWARSLLGVLKPGGHLFVGDHTGQLRLAIQLRLLHEAGFVDVDVAWRVDDMFVIGCRRPLQHSEAAPSKANSAVVAAPVASSLAEISALSASGPSAPAAAATASAHPAAASSAAAASDVPAAAAAAAPVDATATPAATAAPSHSQRQSWMEDEEISQMIAALQAQNEELKSRLAAAPPAAQQAATDESGAPPAAAAVDASSSSSSSGPSASLLSKLPLLFSRFDPSRSGQLTYAALQSLCRAVGREVDDGEDSLWWTYQSIAQADPETGNIGISIEDLTQHFYKAPGMWSLSDDLHKLGII